MNFILFLRKTLVEYFEINLLDFTELSSNDDRSFKRVLLKKYKESNFIIISLWRIMQEQ